MDELKELENQLTTGIVAEPPMKGHYETVKEYTREDSVYDENGNPIGSKIVVIGREAKWVWDDPEEIKKEQDEERKCVLKTELAQIKEDIEQEAFGLVRDDFAAKKAQAAEIVNELRVLEGKTPREVRKNEEAD